MEPSIHFLPQAVDPDEAEWSVREVDPLQSNVNLFDHTAEIPRARTRASEQIRLHEMGHVAYSEKHIHDNDMATIICRMCEEVRIDALLLIQQRIDVRHRHDDFEWNPAEIDNKPFERAMQWLQTYLHCTLDDVAVDVRNFNNEMWRGLPAALQ